MRNQFGVKPRVFLYNRVMDALVRTGHLDLALSVYDDLKEDGLVEESVTFMVLVKGLCKCGRIDEMLEVLGRMRERLCKPDVFAYTALVKILVPAGNLDACLRVWEEMKRDRVVPDVKAYATMIVGLAKGGRVQEGYELFREMKGKGCLVDRVIYGALVEAFVAEGKVELAFDLLKDLGVTNFRANELLCVVSFLLIKFRITIFSLWAVLFPFDLMKKMKGVVQGFSISCFLLFGVCLECLYVLGIVVVGTVLYPSSNLKNDQGGLKEVWILV